MPLADGRSSTPQPSLLELLERTSRTFALAIPLLPEPTQTTVCLAYLLFRVADTLEDAAAWPRDERLRALDELSALLNDPTPEHAQQASAQWVQRKPTDNASYLELLAAVPLLLAAVARLEGPVRRIVIDHVQRTTQGMRETVESGDAAGRVRITTLKDLRRYCYVVAGIVGELLTALFVHDAPELRGVAPSLAEHQAEFGEGLQLVNILKDEAEDEASGRVFLPAGVERSEVFALARGGLAHAHLYVEALVRGHAPDGFIAFTSLPAQLADATLPRLERDGAGAKVPRAEVMALLARLLEAR